MGIDWQRVRHPEEEEARTTLPAAGRAEARWVGIALQLAIVALLGVIAFELAWAPRPVDTSRDIQDLEAQVGRLEGQLQGLNTKLQEICILTNQAQYSGSYVVTPPGCN